MIDVQSGQTQCLRLGVNVDHVATVRNARGGIHPDPVRAALLAAQAGADGITAHLREDRRHISDADIAKLMADLHIPLNLEMAATEEMLTIALRHRPHAVCIVPEKRQERTTEGGLNVADSQIYLSPFVRKLTESGARVSMFIEPDERQLDAVKNLDVPVVELHTGAYCDAPAGILREQQLERIQHAADYADKIGLECHAGHGLGYDTVGPIAAITTLTELNIGHFLIGEAIFIGFQEAIRRMRKEMEIARIPA
ncbi:MAG: pyridoxine 5'-phosphate synthase [Candidatus Marinimicrobia bacterium]|nr:pyridoxine 5'-phosphate synthase [Candidatus Neomarinimicrobiota bacterium]